MYITQRVLPLYGLITNYGFILSNLPCSSSFPSMIDLVMMKSNNGHKVIADTRDG